MVATYQSRKASLLEDAHTRSCLNLGMCIQAGLSSSGYCEGLRGQKDQYLGRPSSPTGIECQDRFRILFRESGYGPRMKASAREKGEDSIQCVGWQLERSTGVARNYIAGMRCGRHLGFVLARSVRQFSL